MPDYGILLSQLFNILLYIQYSVTYVLTNLILAMDLHPEHGYPCLGYVWDYGWVFCASLGHPGAFTHWGLGLFLQGPT